MNVQNAAPQPSPTSAPEEPFLDLVGIAVPIVQAPMAGSATPRLAAAVSDAGGLGGLGLGTVGVDDARRQIREAHALGVRHLNVNFFLHDTPPRTRARDVAALAGAKRVARTLEVAVEVGTDAPFEPFGPDMLEMTLHERPSVVTFHFGVPDPATVAALHEREIVIGVSATTADEAVAVEQASCDFVIAQGAEAGGHRGQFAPAMDAAAVGTFALVPQIADAVKIPVVAAGGIADGRGLVAARALGASAVQVGTAFLLCDEAAVAPGHRRAILESSGHDTVVTSALSGRPARAIRTDAIVALEAEAPPTDFPIQFSVTAGIRSADVADRPTAAMWAGQAAPLARQESAGDVIRRLVREAAAVHGGMGRPHWMEESTSRFEPRSDVPQSGVDVSRQLQGFIDDIRQALKDSAPVEATEAILRKIAVQATPDWCAVPEGVAERLLHHEPECTVYLLSGAPGVRFCPHEHTVAVSTLVLQGQETNVWYRELDDGSVRRAGSTTSAEGAVGHMKSDVIHAVEYRSADRPLSLHVYHGDLLNASRRMWSIDGSNPRPYDQDEYDEMTIGL
ncbi:nitronate monooxygenase [Ilumatobacter sp.]|uniref:nitronate monooxygenase n=1 Tax=Ilumatobacter sp. TaxID=1967498 RepID=UPI003C3BDCC1